METPNELPTSPTVSATPAYADPVEAVAVVLQAVAVEPSAVLSAETKLHQRATLLAAAQKQMSIRAPEEQKKAEAPRTMRTWFALGGVSLAVAFAALVLFIHVPASPLNVVGVVQFEEVNRLAISAAQAETLFTVPAVTALVIPEKNARPKEEGLVIASRLPVTADQLRATIQVTPAVPFEVMAVAKAQNTFRIVPKTQTVTAANYRITLPTLVTNEDGSRTTRQFTWSLQSDTALRVRSTIPAQAATDVPEDTGIEFALNHFVKGVTSSTITLTPPTPGRVEMHGQTLVFVPSAPLKTGTYYRARLADIATTDGLVLADPIEIAFETSLTDTQREALSRRVTFASEFSEVSPNAEVRLGLYAAKGMASSTVEVMGYSLSPEQAQRVLAARTKRPTWSTVSSQQDTDYTTNVTQEAFRVQTTLEQIPEAPGYTVLRLPKGLDAGFYALKLTVSGTEPQWAFVQSTRIASYTVADKKNVIVWTVNTETKKILNHVLVQSPEGSALTNDQGIAELPAPDFSTETAGLMRAEQPVRILTLQNDTDQAFVVLSGTQSLFRYQGESASGLLTTWGYLFADRPLYHPSDELHVAGIVMDRETHTVPSDVHVQVRAATPFFDAMGQNANVYQDVVVTPDASGRFEQTLQWSAMLPGYYTIVLIRAGQVVMQRPIEVREFTKPAYEIDVIPAKTRQYIGEKIQLALRARFYDGTSFPGAILKVTPMQGGIVQEAIQVTLDSNGEAQIVYQPQPIPCGSQQTEACHVMEPVEFEARPLSAEEGEIVGAAVVEVYATSMNVQLSERVQGKDVLVTMKTILRDLGAVSEEKEAVEPVPSVALEGLAIGYYYEAIPEGTYYDFIQKVTKPAYRYERRRDSRPLPIGVQTNAKGEATYRFTMNPERDYYEVIVGGRDAQGRAFRSLTTISRGWSEVGFISPSVNETPKLVLTDVQPDHVFNLGDHVAMQYVHGTTPLDVSDTPGVFVFTASRGVRDARLVDTNEISLTFDERSLPNTEVHAVTFWKGRFEAVQTTLLYRKELKELLVTLEPLSATTKPGEVVQVKVHVQKKDGTPVQATTIALAAVDTSLYALTGPQAEDPLTALYETVPTGIENTVVSHQDTELGGLGAGGGGMRSAAMDAEGGVRRAFKDTAAFSVVTLDDQGSGLFAFTAPDNLTSWRVTGIALNGALEAGVATTDVRVTKPSFVEVVIPARLLTTDAPVLQVRAFGADLTASSSVRLTVTAPTLGLNNVELVGTVFAPSYVPITSPAAGIHKITVRVQTERGEDTVEREVRVSSSFFTKQESVAIDVAPGTGLPPLGMPEAQIVLASTGRIELLPELQAFAQLEGLRLDTRVAREIARTLLRENYHQDFPAGPVASLLEYQSSLRGEGLKLLPYGSSDLALSADVVNTLPNSFDHEVMSQLFYGVLASATASRDAQIDALMGLASINEPVATDLQVLATRTDLTTAQLLRVARGLLSVGDQATATTLVERVLAQTTVQDGQRFVNASRLADRITYTADLAALTAELHRDESSRLYAYVATVWHEDAFPILAKIRYIRARLAVLPIDNGEVTWTIGGAKTKTISFKDDPVHVFTLTASEATNFRITSVSGPTRLSFVRRTTGRPSSVPSVHLTRSYQAAQTLTDLRIGTEVTVTLTPRWDADAREGCYLIRDHVPGGLQPVLQTKLDHRSYYTNDFDPLTGEISFVSCKKNNSEPIRYRTRIVAKGTYTAEAPVMEHLEYPSISTLGQDEILTIK